MFYRDKAIMKVNALFTENMNLRVRIQNLETELDILTDQYMNGDICHNGNIGREQYSYQREIYKLQRKLRNNEDTIYHLCRRYNITES